MKLTEITIGVSRTFNLGNFESLRVEASASASVDLDSEGYMEEARLALLAEVRETLRRTYMEFRPPPKKGELDV